MKYLTVLIFSVFALAPAAFAADVRQDPSLYIDGIIYDWHFSFNGAKPQDASQVQIIYSVDTQEKSFQAHDEISGLHIWGRGGGVSAVSGGQEFNFKVKFVQSLNPLTSEYKIVGDGIFLKLKQTGLMKYVIYGNVGPEKFEDSGRMNMRDNNGFRLEGPGIDLNLSITNRINHKAGIVTGKSNVSPKTLALILSLIMSQESDRPMPR